jgi:hypothetical protein
MIFQTLLDSLLNSLLAKNSKTFRIIKLVLEFRRLLEENQVEVRGTLERRNVRITLTLLLSNSLKTDNKIQEIQDDMDPNLVIKNVISFTLKDLYDEDSLKIEETIGIEDDVIIDVKIPEETNEISANFVGLFISEFAEFSKSHNAIYGNDSADFFFDYPDFTRQEIFEIHEYQLMSQAMNEDGLNAKLKALKRNQAKEKK